MSWPLPDFDRAAEKKKSTSATSKRTTALSAHKCRCLTSCAARMNASLLAFGPFRWASELSTARRVTPESTDALCPLRVVLLSAVQYARLSEPVFVVLEASHADDGTVLARTTCSVCVSDTVTSGTDEVCVQAELKREICTLDTPPFIAVHAFFHAEPALSVSLASSRYVTDRSGLLKDSAVPVLLAHQRLAVAGECFRGVDDHVFIIAASDPPDCAVLVTDDTELTLIEDTVTASDVWCGSPRKRVQSPSAVQSRHPLTNPVTPAPSLDRAVVSSSTQTQVSEESLSRHKLLLPGLFGLTRRAKQLHRRWTPVTSQVGCADCLVELVRHLRGTALSVRRVAAHHADIGRFLNWPARHCQRRGVLVVVADHTLSHHTVALALERKGVTVESTWKAEGSGCIYTTVTPQSREAAQQLAAEGFLSGQFSVAAAQCSILDDLVRSFEFQLSDLREIIKHDLSVFDTVLFDDDLHAWAKLETDVATALSALGPVSHQVPTSTEEATDQAFEALHSVLEDTRKQTISATLARDANASMETMNALPEVLLSLRCAVNRLQEACLRESDALLLTPERTAVSLQQLQRECESSLKNVEEVRNLINGLRHLDWLSLRYSESSARQSKAELQLTSYLLTTRQRIEAEGAVSPAPRNPQSPALSADASWPEAWPDEVSRFGEVATLATSFGTLRVPSVLS